jgi:2-amino-4-hydroxy-6-hydroxymethyldihydropteridine diphosphokinase
MLREAFTGIRFSSLYRSAAQHITDQAEFLNAAAVLETELSPDAIAAELQKIEKALKKNTPQKFGPRTIDLDLLLYGQEISLDDELTIPHLRLHTRRFVLEPLIELGAGDLNHPGFDRKLNAYLKETKDQHCEKTTLKGL